MGLVTTLNEVLAGNVAASYTLPGVIGKLRTRGFGMSAVGVSGPDGVCKRNCGGTAALTAAMRPISIATKPATEIWELPYQSNVRPIAMPATRDTGDPKGCVRECRLSIPVLRMRKCKRQASRRRR